MLNEPIEFAKDPVAFRRKTIVNQLLPHARHPKNVPGTIELLATGDPLIFSTLIDLSLPPGG